ncbi:glucosyltransferase [Salipaludibacillus sp. LMS25]|uniref:macrolide family glycosyltransferase n=1 Tax=Salipaludibacillus sp. LMS25 TaxID=2924031 RepID=UPI0020D0799A|nr:macrolide family glycosyltransferase [Salipaludibacillus sp. LMS25]UTR13995.1 glucosyltransferase [Salipaludibacillus sp. LMS25]
MSKIVFFSIPAHGHTNPTLPVVSELVNRGHDVWYYSFMEFREKIERCGAKFIPCDEFLPSISQQELERKVGKDFAALIEMIADTTLALEKQVSTELREFKPDCVVSDSLALWGKLLAQKFQIPYICSTTSFAFNQYTAKLMKPSAKEIWRTIIGMGRINKKMKMLRAHGFAVKSFISVIQNDNETDTIVFTSKEFQPLSETFSDRYAFVGPSIRKSSHVLKDTTSRKFIYISLGTVLNQHNDFYQNCMKAFADSSYEVLMSVGENTNISSLGRTPDNFTIRHTVDQVAVLQKTDVFITHGGMNSVNESLYYGVPMVLYPFHSEQRLVADRVVELGAGIKLKGYKMRHLTKAVADVLTDPLYQKNVEKLAKSIQHAGGAGEAANVIMAKAAKHESVVE